MRNHPFLRYVCVCRNPPENRTWYDQAWLDPAGSDSEPLATLGAARIQYSAARTRRHAGAEAVGALALDLAWLVSAFHGSKTTTCPLGQGAARVRSAAAQVNYNLGFWGITV